jgi:hypothetical protein
MVEQLDSAAVQYRQHVPVKVTLRFIGGQILDAMNGEALARL